MVLPDPNVNRCGLCLSELNVMKRYAARSRYPTVPIRIKLR